MLFFNKKRRKKLILIVEDDQILLEMYLERLKQENFNVITALNGEEALNIINYKKPDLILLDLVMPKKGGLGVIQILKSHSAFKDIPIIVMTAYPQDNYRQMAMENKVNDFVSKSEVMPSEIVNKIKFILSK